MTRQRFVTDTELGEVGRITHGEGLLAAEQLIAVHGGENHLPGACHHGVHPRPISYFAHLAIPVEIPT